MHIVLVGVLLMASWSLCMPLPSHSAQMKCEPRTLAQIDYGREGEMPSLQLENRVFSCADIDSLLPKSWDQLENDLFFLRAKRYTRKEFSEHYADMPQTQLNKLWDLVQKVKAEQQRQAGAEEKPPVSPKMTVKAIPEKPVLRLDLGHSDTVSAIAYSPSGSLVATASEEEVIVWDVTSGAEVRRFQGLRGRVSFLLFAPDSMSLLAAADPTSEAADGSFVYFLELSRDDPAAQGPFSSPIKSAVFGQGGASVFLALADLTVLQVDAGTGKRRRTFGASGDDGVAVLSPDGRRVFLCGVDHVMRLRDLLTWEEVWSEKVEQGDLTAAFSSDGRLIVTHAGGRLQARETSSGKVIHEVETPSGGFSSPAFSPDNNLFSAVIRGSGTAVFTWSMPEWRLVGSVSTEDQDLWYLAYPSSGNRLLTGGGYGGRLWLYERGQEGMTFTEEKRFVGRSGGVMSVAFSSDGSLIATGGRSSKHGSGKIASVWDATGTGKIKQQFKSDSEGLVLAGGSSFSLAFSPDSTELATCSVDGRLMLWDVGKGNATALTPEKDELLFGLSVAFSPDGHLVASGNLGGASIWSRQARKKLRDLEGHTAQVNQVSFSPDGKLVGSASNDGRAALWSVATGEPTQVFEGHQSWVSSIAFSPDGLSVVTGSWDKTAMIWNVGTSGRRLVISGHTGSVNAVAFSPDGRSLATGADDGSSRLWDSTTGAEIGRFEGHSAAVSSLAFSRDGRLLLTGSTDGTAGIWEVSSEKELGRLVTLDDGTWVVFTPDGRFDTNNLEEIKGLHWIMPDQPLHPFPPEILMRDYYEPRLLPRILAGEKFRQVRDLQALNRVQPSVAMRSVTLDAENATVSVAVEVAGASLMIGNRKISTGVNDVKIFRDGQLVGFREGKTALDESGKATITFSNIRLPQGQAHKQVEFSAYAFNDDGVKSASSRVTYKLPATATLVRGKAYLVNIGINRYQNSEWNLQYATSDAEKIRLALETRIPRMGSYSEVIPVMLTDELATKGNIRSVLALLAGEPVPAPLRQNIPNGEKISRATPEDMLVISFSGHGYVDEEGIFYAFTQDTGNGGGRTISKELLTRIVSSDELTKWLRPVDAGDMAMIVDACHSAATVGADFKAGPMGSRGLGQLAYDKGMRILAASQADDVALESDNLRQGLLTYALIHDGMDAFQADFKPKDGKVMLSEWLAYGVERVPALAEEVRKGAINTFGRGEVIRIGNRKENSLTKKNGLQTPSLFDFTRRSRDLVLMQ